MATSSSSDEEGRDMAVRFASVAVSAQDVFAAMQKAKAAAAARSGKQGRATRSSAGAAAQEDSDGGEQTLDLTQLKIAAALDAIVERRWADRDAAAPDMPPARQLGTRPAPHAGGDAPGEARERGGQATTASHQAAPPRDAAPSVRVFRQVPTGTPCRLHGTSSTAGRGAHDVASGDAAAPVAVAPDAPPRRKRRRGDADAPVRRAALAALAVDGFQLVAKMAGRLAAGEAALPAHGVVVEGRPSVPHDLRMAVLLGRRLPAACAR